jgi:hypothetical protein
VCAAAKSLLLVVVAGLAATACGGFRRSPETPGPAQPVGPVSTCTEDAGPVRTGDPNPARTEEETPTRTGDAPATLTIDQGSFRMSMDVGPDGSIDLSEHTPLVGRIDVGPILDAEDRNVSTVQVLLHEGRYYIAADGFRNLWEVTPTPGTTVATFRPIFVSDLPLSNVRLARYGPAGNPCVRLDATKTGGPWFLNDEGRLRDHCP